MEIFKRFTAFFERNHPEWTPGTYNQVEEPLPRERSAAEDKDFLLLAMEEAKAHLEIAEAWADEFPEAENLKAALILAGLSLQEAFKNVPDIS